MKHFATPGSLGHVIKTLRSSKKALGIGTPLKARRQPKPVTQNGARFTRKRHTGVEGTRDYKLYVPTSTPDAPKGLIVMLHGCKQNPDDFAIGTGMNRLAEAHGLIVAYPGQSGAHNPSSCWNWFNPGDQTRDAGEPAIIAGITRALMSKFGLGRETTFIAGLSAGGAMAAIMARTYPDLYDAMGIHSGLPYGAASDVMGAFAAMRGQGTGMPSHEPECDEAGPTVRTIVFHGSADTVVHPTNAQEILAVASANLCSGPSARTEHGSVNGRDYVRILGRADDGRAAVEGWIVTGAGHAWSGGNPAGSFAEASGPDASAEMVRFFFDGQ